MAGIEHIVVHSKSYVVRWIEVAEHHSLSWSVQPQKRSINFGIFKHPGTKTGLTPVLPVSNTFEQPPPLTPGLESNPGKTRRNSANTANVVDKLQAIGLRAVAWAGRCDAERVSMGRYDVPDNEGGMYGLVFDNTFSKQTSKNVTFVLITHPTSAPPKSGHHLHYAQAFTPSGFPSGGGGGLSGGDSPTFRPMSDSNESLPGTANLHRAVLEDPRPNSKGKGVETKGIESTSFYTGILHKKRRKKGQGYAKRFFSLDFTSSTLSYYHDRHSSALRGAVPLSLAVIGENEKTREFSVDSGAEVWHLKAHNKKDFEGWRHALERASSSALPASASALLTPIPSLGLAPPRNNLGTPAENYEWARLEQLVSKVAGTRDAVRGLAKDTDPKYAPSSHGLGLRVTTSNGSSSAISPISTGETGGHFADMEETRQERRPFWKRSSSASGEKNAAALMRRSVSATLAVPVPSAAAATPPMPMPMPTSRKGSKYSSAADLVGSIPDAEVHERCMALLRDLNRVVTDFAALIAESKARRLPPISTNTSRMSLDSVDQEFFDADDGFTSPTQLLSIGRSSELDDQQEEALEETLSDGDSDADSEVGIGGAQPSAFERIPTTHDSLLSTLPQSLPPLPLQPVSRRTTIPKPKQSPPSIIGFLRKNAGKDLSTVTMPVTANEPQSLLQRLAENMEYSGLLDQAASTDITPAERLMYMAAFAVSNFANNRVKERAVRKPFNPMLGETFELVREDLGFRFLAEKVSHRPVRLACQAESLTNGGWSLAQSPQPVQKFWGKSVELNTEGRVHVMLHAAGEHYSWNQATCFLRNVIAGEKYVEPVQSMTVLNETTGMRAVAVFKAGGMFSGRSEEVTVQLFDTDNDTPLRLGLVGKWTDELSRTDTNTRVWTAGSLVPDAPATYGLTSFAATLNQITEIEKGHLAPTDSRLRPDQQALEENAVDRAEALKAKLEERQRARRKVMETHGQEWKPQFFEKVSDMPDEDEVWRLREEHGYWKRRVKGDWSGVQEVFET